MHHALDDNDVGSNSNNDDDDSFGDDNPTMVMVMIVFIISDDDNDNSDMWLILTNVYSFAFRLQGKLLKTQIKIFT